MNAHSTHTPDVEQLRRRIRSFVREQIIPAEPRPGETLQPEELQRLKDAAAGEGLLSVHVSEEHGGAGVPLRDWPVLFQEAGYSPIGPAVLNIMAPDEGNMHMLSLVANEEQKERYLRPLAAGQVRSSFAMTEPHPGAGSDPNSLTSSAEFSDGQWVLNGHKRFISGAYEASFFIAMMRTPAHGDSPEGATMFFVDADNPGVRVGEPIHTVDTTIAGGHPHVYFDDCKVDSSAVIGAVGRGFEYAQVRLGPARLTHCMRWLGLARRSLDIALDRAEKREIFGDKLYRLGLAQELIAQCEIDIETSAALIEKTARKLEEDEAAGRSLSSIAKVYVSEAVYRVIDRCVQICGGDGVSDGLPLIQYLNEVRPFRIYDGSTETHKFAIARRASSRRRKEVQAGAPDQGTAALRPCDGDDSRC
ncbi:acyl-CoA dehydrogenase family protein [Brevibacterium sp. HMSC063G07]|uniref:acyl-CoA dehydrogenase family protein n=1 Tax=Brevibacterium sp. HMSC063G07 TaxID=1739261 RepID=UPI0008A38521|nr:acyl-CoA dehydrogenase family protein [Brevibacterium sp. HMSC063G07]OFL64139.1 acyl-CoA dehydrogenase [Brevibacterium sp. HMSC063G07]